MEPFLNSFNAVKLGWLATIGGSTVTASMNLVPDASAVEGWLRNGVLLFTIVSLAFTVALQFREWRRGKKQ